MFGCVCLYKTKLKKLEMLISHDLTICKILWVIFQFRFQLVVQNYMASFLIYAWGGVFFSF